MIKNPLPILMLAVLVLILAYGFIAPRTPISIGPGQGAQQPAAACTEGQSSTCRIGNCSGVSTCIAGSWSACRWEQVCSPGSRVTCVSGGCAYAIKACNECGTGFGPCINGSAQ